MGRRVATAFAVLTSAFVLAVTLAAQQSATIYLRSGEQVNGDLIDFAARGFAIRVNGQEREIPRGDVAMIDFGGGDFNRPSQVNDMTEGQNVAVLRNGEVVVGQFMDIGGRAPLRLTFATSNGERELSGNDVRRIYLARTDAGGGGTAASLSGSNVRSFRVDANTAWTNTNIVVRQGQVLRFEASGEVTTAPDATGGPSGNGKLDRNNPPIPSAQMGSLVGRIGNAPTRTNRGNTFMIGDQRSVVMPADGVLYLGVNDSGLRDNSGYFDVKIAID